MRSESFGQRRKHTFIDRFGVWLSAHQLRKQLPSLRGLAIADVGCGYHATFARSTLNEVASLTLLDVALSPEVRALPKTTACEGDLLESLAATPTASFDVVLCVSVLEHLWDAGTALAHFQRVLKPGGTLIVNVPTWRGKKFLEFSAFKLGLSPAAEMDDHKMYYDRRDLWPLLVRAGFRPSTIRCIYHKFGMNLFAVARKHHHLDSV